MGGEIDDAVIGQRRALERGFAGVLAEMNIGSRDAEVFGNRVEFVGGVGQLRQGVRQPRAVDAGALPEIGVGAGRKAAGRGPGGTAAAQRRFTAGLKMGSPKPVIGLVLCSRRAANTRRAFRLAADGKIDTA